MTEIELLQRLAGWDGPAKDPVDWDYAAGIVREYRDAQCSALASDRDRLAKELEQERAKLQAAERVIDAARLPADDHEIGPFPELRKALAAYDRATREDGSRAGGAGGKE